MKYLLVSFTLLLFALQSARAQVSNAPTASLETIIQELTQLEREKDKAYERGDKAALDRIYADDYQAITANGAITTKRTILDFFPRPNIFQWHRSEDIVVRVFGNVAVVTGVLKRKLHKDIKPRGESTLRYTNIYTKTNDTWRIVAAQFSPLKK